MQNKLQAISKHFGLKLQLSKLQEEASELIRAVSKIKDTEDITKRELAELVEEIADTEILLYQIKLLLNNDGRIDIYKKIGKCKDFKIRRTIDRYDIKI